MHTKATEMSVTDHCKYRSNRQLQKVCKIQCLINDHSFFNSAAHTQIISIPQSGDFNLFYLMANVCTNNV